MANETPQRRPTQQQPGGPSERPRRMPGSLILWLVLMAVVLYWISEAVGGGDRPAISYTAFKNQVRAGNVTDVTVEGNRITGTLESPAEIATEEQGTQQVEAFATVKPPFEDAELLSLLEREGVTIEAREQERSWLAEIFILMLPWILILGLIFYANRSVRSQVQNMSGPGGVFNIGRSKAKRYRRTMDGVTYDDVAGLESAKQDLREIVEYLRSPERFKAIGAHIPKGVLLTGPPGTGKTLLARATAGEANAPFYSISGSEFVEMFVGVGASRVRDMFQQAKREAPSIVFIDEIDAVGRTRGTGIGGGHDEREQTLNQILSEMDGFEAYQSVVVMAATNRPDVLDPALTRPGRFDRRITLDLPPKTVRRKILSIHVKHVPLAPEVELDSTAARTVGFSGADLQNLVNEAALLAGRKKKTVVGPFDFDEAVDRLLLGAEREDMMEEGERRLVAFHEGGHALLASLLPNTDPLQKVTIIPRGRSLGSTEQIPETDRHNLTQSYLLDRITVTLGGRAAEMMVFGEVSTGTASDLKGATAIARQMVCQWGMSERMGPVAVNQGEMHPFLGRELTQERDYSEHTARIIDDEVRNVIRYMEERAADVLQRNRIALERLAEELLEHETLSRDEINRLVREAGATPEPSVREQEGKPEPSHAHV